GDTGAAAAIEFLQANPTSIGVRESGLAEQSLLAFRVTDNNGVAVPGQVVEFDITSIGGESVNPVAAVTDVNGRVETTLTSGTRSTTVRVTARADSDNNGSLDVAGQSTAVAILGAPPAFNRFSVGPLLRNVAGRVVFGIEDPISIFVNDRFGNAVPPGTSVSLITNGASVVDQTSTNENGVASAILLTEGVVPQTGIVTVLAFTRGEETFIDNNGNGVFDSGTDSILTDDTDEPFIDFRPLPMDLAGAGPDDTACTIPIPSALCNNAFDINEQFELFVDTQPIDGAWNSQGTTGVWDKEILVWAATTVTFSGPTETVEATPTNFVIPNGGSAAFTLLVHDDLRNPLVGGSTISVTANAGDLLGGDITIPDGQSFNQLKNGLTRFTFVLTDSDAADTDPAEPTSITVEVTSPNGNRAVVVASGTID
ncbi:MAG: hypothetical protein E4H00_02465, partial [Myxococcales bacterium]